MINFEVHNLDFFKNIVPSKRLRFRIISLFKFIPDKPMLKFQYRMKCHRKLNLDDPKRFTEKIQWYKLYYKNDNMPVCCDKYLVREYVKNKGYGHLLNELYDVYKKPEDIDISGLPDKFVLKLSNGSATNLIVNDKSTVSEEEIISKFKHYVAQSDTTAGREWPYHVYDRVITAEKLLYDASTENGLPDDYKVLRFNGEPEYIIHIAQRYTEKINHLTYDKDWNKIEVEFEGSDCTDDAEKPANLDEILKIARDLSEGFPFARIDLYSIGEKIYFGEITFFPWSGYMEFKPDSFDYELGEKFVLPEKIIKG